MGQKPTLRGDIAPFHERADGVVCLMSRQLDIPVSEGTRMAAAPDIPTVDKSALALMPSASNSLSMTLALIGGDTQ